MSLLDDYARTCTKLVKEQVRDDEGGWKTEWKDGDSFINYQALDSSMEARRAEKEGVTSLYNALVSQEVDIGYDDYFRDEESGITYKVTSIPSEKESPASATFSLKFFTAERKEVPA